MVRQRQRLGMAVAIFVLLIAAAGGTTAIVYVVVYGVLCFLASVLGLPDRASWVPFAGTCLLFLIALGTTLCQRIPDLAQLTWDAGTTQDCPSRINIPHWGGRLWNMNPFGPQSITSMVAIGGVILCAGPSLAVSAFVAASEELARNDQHPT